jgi:farnesol dehydrogenase
MKILVTGATGFVGERLVRALLKNHQVTCFVRSKKTLSDLKNLNFIFGDINDQEAIDKAVKGHDVVYHLVGIGNVNACSKKDYFLYKKINVEGTRNILDACLKYKIKKIIYLSSTAAMGLIKEKIVTENTPCNPHTPYQKSKFESEQLIKEYFDNRNLPIIILRPSMIYGAGMYHGALIQINNFFKKGIVPLIGGGKSIIPAIHVNDVVDAILLATENGKDGETYIITNETLKTLKEMVELMERESGKKIIKLNIPKSLIKIPVFFIQHISSLLGIKPILTLQRIDSMTTNRIFNISKAKKELGWTPQTDLDKGLKETINWLVRNHT